MPSISILLCAIFTVRRKGYHLADLYWFISFCLYTDFMTFYITCSEGPVDLAGDLIIRQGGTEPPTAIIIDDPTQEPDPTLATLQPQTEKEGVQAEVPVEEDTAAAQRWHLLRKRLQLEDCRRT